MATKRLKRPRDSVALAKLIGDIATGQLEDATEDRRNQTAAALGSKGGRARAKTLSAKQRKTAARHIPAELLAEQWYSFKHVLLEKLQRFFRENKLRQEDIAESIDRDPALISRWLRGRQNMNLRTMHDLARGMGCRLRIELDPLDKITPGGSLRSMPRITPDAIPLRIWWVGNEMRWKWLEPTPFVPAPRSGSATPEAGGANEEEERE